MNRLLENAPITEALIDIRVTARSGFTSGVLDSIKSRFAEFFPSLPEEQRQGELFLQLVEGQMAAPPAIPDRGVTGLLFRAIDRNEAVQVQEDGFVFSKLRPYTSWEDVSLAARRYWDVYTSVVQLAQINRVAVRYINQFTIPRHRLPSDYLTAAPLVPEGIRPESVRNSLSRMLLVGPSNILSRVQQACDTVEVGTVVVIDIDCFRQVQFEPSDDTFWSSLEELRAIKNTIFFGSITPNAAEEFDR